MASEYGSTTQFLQDKMTTALNKVAETKSAIIKLSGATPNTASSKFKVDIKKPTIGSPPKISDLLEMDSTKPEILRLNTEADAYMAKYFPAISGGLLTLPEDWLIGVISGTKPFGIDSTIFDMVWQKARDRAQRSRLSEQRSLEANMSARGFSMPPGALIDLSDSLSQKIADELAEVNRDEAIKDAEIKKDILLFAVEQALRYKLGLMQAMADLYKVWAIIPNNGVEHMKAKASAMSSFYNALSSYYNVEMAYEELKVKAEIARTGVEQNNAENKIRAFAAGANNASLGQVAAAFGDIASGAASGAASIVAQIENI